METSRSDASQGGAGIAEHSGVAKFFHWGFAALFIFALTKQLDEVEELEDFALLQYEMVFASIFLAILLVRFVFMRSTRPTVLPPDTPRRTLLLARAVHLAMYASIGGIAITGLSIGGLFWAGTKTGAAMEAMLILHEIAVISTYWLILGHATAAIYHRRERDGIWDSMVPVWKERRDR